jgi:ribonuclease III
LKQIVKSARVYFSSDKKLYNSLKNLLGFYPKNLNLYKLAFRHTSVAKHIKEGVKDSNERLEFLGDAVLDAVIAHYLFQLFPFKDEGFLTKVRSKLVSRTQLNKLAGKLGIINFLDLNLEPGARYKSIEGDAFEALIGAIYLDKGYKKTNDFILNRIFKVHLDIQQIIETEIDFKSRLIEWAQKEKKQLGFVLVGETGKGNEKQYEVEVRLEGKTLGRAQNFSKKRAEQMAAEESLMQLGDI